MNDYYIIYSVLFFFCTILSALTNKLFIKFSKTLGIRNHDVSIVRWSSQSKPAFGGITFYITFLFACSIYNLAFAHGDVLVDKTFIGLISATSLAFLMGLYDDAYNTNPLLKLGTQILCGIILIVTGTCITIFDNNILNYALTILWVVGVMNSINMLDNMDGITTLVSIFIILSCLLVVFLHSHFQPIHVVSLIGVLGALIGFLIYNWNPSKIFMGDTGSQFLGVFLAGIGIMYFWNNKELDGDKVPIKQIIITLLAFIIPIIDTTTVTINRLKRGQAPYIGGKDHTTHHLSYLGLSDKQVARLFGLLSLISFVLIYVIVQYLNNWNNYLTAIFILYILVLFAGLYGTTQVPKAKKKFQQINHLNKKKA